MAYQPVLLHREVPPRVAHLLRGGVDPVLADVHAMLRLPLKRPKLDAGCNFTIAHALLAVIAGVSSAFYTRGLKDGEAFIDLMVRFYPWELEEGQSEIKSEILWKTFRNPFAHSLGLAFEKSRGHRRLRPRDFQTKIGRDKPTMKERAIVAVERSLARPPLNPTLVVAPHKRVLWVEPLYWGVRTMITRLSCDLGLMREVEAALDGDIAASAADRQSTVSG